LRRAIVRDDWAASPDGALYATASGPLQARSLIKNGRPFRYPGKPGDSPNGPLETNRGGLAVDAWCGVKSDMRERFTGCRFRPAAEGLWAAGRVLRMACF